MRITSFLDGLARPLTALLALLVTVTFLARIPAVAAWSGRRYLGQFDLWTEGSLAALASGGFFVLAGLSFVTLAWGEATSHASSAPPMGRWVNRWVLRAAALGLVFFAADEVFEIHEAVGARLASTGAAATSDLGEGVFSWILLYGPIVLVGGVLVVVALARLIRDAPRRDEVAHAGKWLAWLVLGPAALLVLEAAEAHLWAQGTKMTVLGAFEETLELVILMVIIRLNVAIAKGYEA